MNKQGPIIIIEDDLDDQDDLTEIFKKLNYGNEVIFFTDGDKVLEFLNKTDIHPFLILSDVNMPKINGFQLRNKVFTNELLKTKCIPYLFFTTAATKKSVLEAYSLSVQGFFLKTNSMAELEKTVKRIMEYWKECIAPNEYA
jgi:CheY-like chemotaxis protein